MTRAQLRVGVVGVGRMGRRHLDVLLSRSDVSVAGVVDRRPVDVPVPRYDTVADLADGNALDLVVVSTSARRHVLDAGQLLREGIACLVDKPLATTPDDALALCEAAEQSGALLAVAHTERFNAAWQVLRDALRDARAAGQALRSVSAERFGPPPRAMDVGPEIELAVHDADLCLELFEGGLRPVAGQVDARNAILELRGRLGEPVTLRAGWHPQPVRRFRVSTSLDEWDVDLLARSVTRSGTGGPSPLAVPDCPREVDAVIDDVLEALRVGRPPRVSGRDGAAAVALVAGVDRAGGRTRAGAGAGPADGNGKPLDAALGVGG